MTAAISSRTVHGFAATATAIADMVASAPVLLRRADATRSASTRASKRLRQGDRDRWLGDVPRVVVHVRAGAAERLAMVEAAMNPDRHVVGPALAWTDNGCEQCRARGSEAEPSSHDGSERSRRRCPSTSAAERAGRTGKRGSRTRTRFLLSRRVCGCRSGRRGNAPPVWSEVIAPQRTLVLAARRPRATYRYARGRCPPMDLGQRRNRSLQRTPMRPSPARIGKSSFRR